MLERKGEDIDALLISALYGELTPADEARLNAHLDSHPADKSALADLTSARNAVRESRFLTVQIEPPQAVSALLLQEASRRAPAKVVAEEKQESWFARFVSSFARHPAMAAAAMLVLVVGVGGLMYMRNGNKAQFAEQATSTFGGADRADRAENAPAPAAAAPADRGVDEAKNLELRAGSSFEATLQEQTAAGDLEANDKAAAKLERSRVVDEKSKQDAKPEPAAEPAKAPKPANRTYIGVETPRPPQPLELDGDSRRVKGAAPGTAGVARNEKTDPSVVATPSPPPPPTAPATTAPRGGGVAVGGAGGGEDALKDQQRDQKEQVDTETSWAREQAVKVTNAVKANNCKEAAALAVQLSNKAPAYYQQNVENDRELKKCMTYINAEREKEAERQNRARALQKRNAEEAAPRRSAPPTTNSTK